MAVLNKAQIIKLNKSVGNFIDFPELPKYSDLDDVGIACVLDVETTDLTLEPVEVTELAIRKFKYNKNTMEVVEILDYIDLFNEPSDLSKLTPEIQTLTHITPDMVKGHKIDNSEVVKFLSNVDFIIAHNASFDSDKVKNALGIDVTVPFHCSQKQIQWTQSHEAVSQGLEILALTFGFDYEGHRAINDVDALLKLLIVSNTLKEMVENSELYTVSVSGWLDQRNSDGSTPVKDALKNRSAKYWFRFDGDNKVWLNDRVTKKDLDSVLDRINSTVQKYNPNGKVTIKVEKTNL